MKEDFEKAKAEIYAKDIMSKRYRERKFRFWLVRSTIGAFLVYYFWHEPWMSWFVWVYVGTALLSLIMIFLTPWLIKRKIAKTEGIIDKVNDAINDAEDGAA